VVPALFSLSSDPSPDLAVPSVELNASHLDLSRSGLILPARFLAPWKPRFQSRHVLAPLPRPADGVAILEPFRERPAGTRNTLAPNRIKA